MKLPISLLLLLCSTSVFAQKWPMFTVPTPQTIIPLLETKGCPAGEGRIKPGATIPVQVDDATWNWVYIGDSQCQKLPKPVTDLWYNEYRETRHNSGGVMVTFFGEGKTRQIFPFAMTIPYCNKEQTCIWTCVSAIINDVRPFYITCSANYNSDRK